MLTSQPSKRLKILTLQMATDQYYFLKFILEGYDGLAVLTKGKYDKVLLRYPAELENDLLQLLESIKKRIHCSISSYHPLL